jgi:ATP-dependent DNA ligase
MELPILYQKDSKNSVKEWKIAVNNSIVTIEYGLINGKKRKIVTEVFNGKNIGKKNETTKEEQAIKYAQSKWNNKKNTGYLETKPNIEVTPIKYEQIRPMLSLDYNKRSKDIEEPFYIQPKLDGVRAIYMNGKFYSRLNKEYIGLEHIKNEINEKIQKNIPILDGELYSDNLTFQELISRLKNSKLQKDDIKYNVYDIVSIDDFCNRYKWILNNLYNFNTVNIVETHLIHDKKLVNNYHNKFVSEGYEGVMVRNNKGSYKTDYRSKDLQKFKKFKEDEYTIVGFKEADGVEKGCVIWICETNDRKTFSVRPEGTHKIRKCMYEKASEYIGKQLTVKYQELTDDFIPRFPVGKSIRDFE